MIIKKGGISLTVITFYYRTDGNYFEDEEGEVIYNIFEYVTPSRLSLIKRHPGYHYVTPPIEDTIYEFYMPFKEDYAEEDEDLYDGRKYA